jgi:hypothetical protein
MDQHQVVNQIAEEIKETVRPLMEKWVEDRITYLTVTRDWMHSEDCKSEIAELFEKKNIVLSGRWNRYTNSMARDQVYANNGISKGDQNLIAYFGADDWLIKTKKEAEQKLGKIKVAVQKKINFDVETVEKISLTEGKDGYMEGSWKLNNKEVFSFETFYAGGYNIQCLHVRTKYKLK